MFTDWFIAALGSFAAIVALLCLALSYLFGGGHE